MKREKEEGDTRKRLKNVLADNEIHFPCSINEDGEEEREEPEFSNALSS